jgi:hypothetical protein
MSYQLLDAFASVYDFPAFPWQRDVSPIPRPNLTTKLAKIVDSITTWPTVYHHKAIEQTLSSISLQAATQEVAISGRRVDIEANPLVPAISGRSVDIEASPLVRRTIDNLQRASHHRSISDKHKILEQFYLVAFAVGAFSPVSLSISFVLHKSDSFLRRLSSVRVQIPIS